MSEQVSTAAAKSTDIADLRPVAVTPVIQSADLAWTAEAIRDVQASQPAVFPQPVQASARSTSLDSLRGFAVLGILLMNIVGMGMYCGAYVDPTIIGGATGINLWTWIVMHIFVDGKMRCLFCMLFGAGVILLTSRLKSSDSAADIYYRRVLWLILFGIAHAYLLWFGDILYIYGLCSLILFPFRKLPARKLFIIGTAIIILNSGLYIAEAYALRSTIQKGIIAEKIQKQRGVLTHDQQSDLNEYQEWRELMRPTAQELRMDAAQWRGNPAQVIKARAEIVFKYFHNVAYYSTVNFDVWSAIFLGMALLKAGVLTGERNYNFYGKLLLLGYGIGIPLSSLTAWIIVNSGFNPVVQAFTGVASDVSRVLVGIGHLSLVMLAVKLGWLKLLMRSLAGIGRTALSNYILQSIIAAFIFTGYGFRLYDSLQRYQLYLVALAIWILELIATSLWLRRFQFGPLEWCWRSLTYWRRQPMRLTTRVVA